MDRVGGYLSYLCLKNDNKAMKQIMIAMRGENDSHRRQALKRKAEMESSKRRKR